MHKLPILLLILFTHTTLANPQPRIVGGTESNPETRNFMAHVEKTGQSPDKGMCGGVMLRKDWVVTAAHCIDEVQSVNEVTVFPGSHDHAAQTVQERIPVKQIFRHAKHNDTTKQYDIALLQLAYPSQVGTPISIVDNSSLNDLITSGATAWAFGRGNTTTLKPGEFSPGNVSPKLLQVELPLVATDVCEDSIGFKTPEGVDPSAFNLTQGQLCAGGVSGKSICKGDSGGPLMVQKNDGFLYLAGLTSWIKGCAQPNQPAIFTRVPAFARALVAVMDGKASTLTGEPNANDTFPPPRDESANPPTGEPETPATETPETETLGSGGNAGDTGGGGVLSIACLPLVALLRRRRARKALG